MLPKLRIYTDGSYSGATGDGGYAILLLTEDDRPLLCIRGCLKSEATNNIMELEAIRQALLVSSGFDASHFQSLSICTDSAYAMGAITSWGSGWRLNNWKTKEGKPVSNKTIIEDSLSHWDKCSDKVQFQKVKAHSTNHWNNVVDLLAKGSRFGVCGKCESTYSKRCSICAITRSEEWLRTYQPSLRHLVKKRGGNVRG
jgi:ribonuclease HI